jgi:hypothetical protein
VSQPPARCADRSGFLFAHDCDRPPAGACSRCRQPICTQHTRSTPEGPVCVTCLRRRDADSSTSSSDTSSSTSSGGSSAGTAAAAAAAIGIGAGAFGGAGASGAWTGPEDARSDPHFYGTDAERASYYDADDFAAFDVPAAAAAADALGGGGPETDTGAS